MDNAFKELEMLIDVAKNGEEYKRVLTELQEAKKELGLVRGFAKKNEELDERLAAAAAELDAANATAQATVKQAKNEANSIFESAKAKATEVGEKATKLMNDALNERDAVEAMRIEAAEALREGKEMLAKGTELEAEYRGKVARMEAALSV